MLNSAEHEICPANKSQITNNCKFFLQLLSLNLNMSVKPDLNYSVYHNKDSSLDCVIPYLQTVFDQHSGSVVERPLCDREVACSIPGRVIPKTL